MENLKPCPFCGGPPERCDNGPTKAELQNALSWGQDVDDGGSFIRCTQCDASTALHFERKENLVDSWNRRSASAEAALADCRETIEVMCAEQVLWRQTERALREEIKKHQTNLRHWREECGKLHAKLAAREVQP